MRDLGTRAVRAGRWMLAIQVVSKLAGLIQRIILARLIAPHDFGLMGIALLTIGGLEAISTPDLASALIRKRGDIHGYLNSLWTCQILRAIFVSTCLIAGAPFLAVFFESPSCVNVIRFVALSMVLRAFLNPGSIHFQKDLEFRPRFMMASSASIAGAVASIICALILHNVWALVVGILFSAGVSCVSSYVLHPYRPKLELSAAKVGEMFRFGGWVWAAGILVFCVTQGDDLVVSRILGVTMLGYYQMAYWVANIPATQISHILAQVSFPAYAELRHDDAALKHAYLGTLQGILIFSIPYGVMICMLAEPITSFIFGSRWEPMVPALKVLCVAGVLRAVSATMGPIFLAIGKPKMLTIGQIIRLVVLAGTVISFTKLWGLWGASLSVMLCGLASLLFYGGLTIRFLNLKLIPFVKKLLPSIIGGSVLILTLLCLPSNMLTTYKAYLILSLGLGVMVYLGSMWSCDIFLRCGTVDVLRKFMGTYR